MKDLIAKTIEKQGPITFARFMQMALYHPQGGYYTSEKNIIGKAGDFYTSVHVSPLFGEMLGEQLAEMAGFLVGDDFKIIEFGAGRGFLALDILQTLQNKYPEIFARTVYFIIEAGPGLRKKQETLLGSQGLDGAKVIWVNSLKEVGHALNGCVISNEVVDAFPVHVVKQCSDRLKEIYVGWDGYNFVEIVDELSTPRLLEYFCRQNIQMENGQRGEINLAALDWIQEVGRSIERGFAITIDYGYEALTLYHPVRKEGTIMCYREHQAGDNPYIHVGKQDITAHVNFSALQTWGEEVGLKVTGFTNQMHFLFNLGIAGKVEGNYKKAMAVQQLVRPEGMGGIFKVLIQHKGLDNPCLQGLTESGS